VTFRSFLHASVAKTWDWTRPARGDSANKCVLTFLGSTPRKSETKGTCKATTARALEAMNTPGAPPLDKENVQDVSQTPEENIVDSPQIIETDKDKEPLDTDAENQQPVNTDPSTDKEDGLKDVDIEEGNKEKENKPIERKRSVAPRSPSQLGRNPPPNKWKKPLWLWALIILVIISLIGTLVITVVSAVKGELSKTALGFLVFFAVIVVCVAPIACYTRANLFAMGYAH